MQELHSIRKEYTLHSLDIANVASQPIDQLKTWFEEALAAKVNEPNAMTLSTVSAGGRPHARIVLVKDMNEEGLTFFTNYESDKGQQIAANPYACLLFFWPELERQIRIEGKVEKLDKHRSEIYFRSRPLGSQLGAHASPQSKKIADRQFLEEKLKVLEKEYEGKTIPIPTHWGGYLLRPDRFEFWQGRPSRLHDRILYQLEATTWEISRLAP